jgi:hypothetical protein
MLDMVGIAVMVVVMGIDAISLQKGKVRESLAFFVEQSPLEKDNISCTRVADLFELTYFLFFHSVKTKKNRSLTLTRD